MRRSPSLLALVTDAFGGRGGIAQYNRDFLRALVATGSVSSLTIMPRYAPDEVMLPARIEQVRARPSRARYSLAAIRSALLHRFDVVFCGHLFMSPLALLIKRLTNAKLILQTHGIEVWTRPSKAQRSAVEAADLVLCVSRHTRAAVLTWADIAPERVRVLPNTVRDEFTPGGGAVGRAALGLASKHILLTVGRLDPRERYKGHERVMAAIPELVAKGYDIHYVVIGEGDDLARLKTVASHSGVSERVHFLGAIGLQNLVETYRMANLFVMPSTGEGFGVVFIEAMASGTPALGFGVGGAKDALLDGELGSTATAEDLVTKIASLLDQQRLPPRQLASAVRNRFGCERFAAAVNCIFNRFIEVGN